MKKTIYSKFQFDDGDKKKISKCSGLGKLQIALIIVGGLLLILLPIFIISMFKSESSSDTLNESSTEDEGPCKSGYLFFNYTGYCYKVFSTPSNFDDAEKLCTLNGGHLASIHSDAENLILVGLLFSDDVDQNQDGAWIGLHFENLVEKWTDSSEFDYAVWEKDEPALDSEKEILFGYLGSAESGWRVGDKLHKRKVICKVPSKNFKNTDDQKKKKTLCSMRGTWFPITNSCFFRIPYDLIGKVTCSEYCQMKYYYAYLTIHSEVENVFVQGFLVKIMKKGTKASVWLETSPSEQNYTWRDLSPVDYKNWVPQIAMDLPACNPLVPHSLLFGYSNDLDYDYVLEAKNDLIGKLRDFKPNIIKLANIRFDVTTPEEPEFHDDIDSFNSSITYRMPDPKLSFPSITQSSDAMSAALKLLNNGGRAPLCGAIVYLLTKRVSMDKDTISGYLILNHAKLYIIQAPAEYGSLYNSTLLDPVRFSRGLNVYCGDRKGLSYALQTMNILFFQYNAFWDNWGIGGRERFQRVLSNARYQSGVFTTPYLKNRNGLLFFTVQCSGPLENFHNINVSFVDTVRNTEQFAYVVKSDLEPYASNAWFQSIHLESYTRYQVYVDLGSYGGWRDCVDIRINSLSPISYWYDYTNN